MKQLSEILDEIAGDQAVRFAALVSRDGFVIENSSAIGQAEELAAARVAPLLFAAEEVGDELSTGGARQIVVKYQSGLLVVDSINSSTLLIIAVASEAIMPWVKHAVRRYLPEISQRL